MATQTTDRIKQALNAELECRRQQIDGSSGLQTVTLAIRLSDGGQVLAVEYGERSRRHVEPGRELRLPPPGSDRRVR